MIAALFIDSDGPYTDIWGIDPWDINRDARKYIGPHPVIAHPPCERWGRYWSGGPSAKVKRKRGDDDGCFLAALRAVKLWGGVIEHPEASHAFKHFGLGKPHRNGGWTKSPDGVGWICCVEQGHYGHKARKATWLYYVGKNKPIEFIWGPSKGERLDEGFHSKEERIAARAAGIKPIKRLSKKENIRTPVRFALQLIELVKNV